MRYGTILLALAMLMFASLGGCRAEDEIKQGAAGEFCNNSDTDCRRGSICDRGICRPQEISGTNCESMCQRIEFCEAEEPDCLATCLATIAGGCSVANPCPWRDEAIEAFGRCIIDDLSCAEIQGGDAPQLCYQEIPLDEARQAECDSLVSAAVTCNESAETMQLRQSCYRLARTTTDAGFDRTSQCSSRVEDGFCQEVEDCLNAVFLLDPPLQLGDGSIASADDPS